MSVPPQADRTVRNKYKLHSVLVHSGGVHGGHYYAYIRPDGKTWLKFDDTAVTIESEEKALNEQFGGEDEPLPAGSPAVKQVWARSCQIALYLAAMKTACFLLLVQGETVPSQPNRLEGIGFG